MRDKGKFIGTLLIGAGIMYLLDPDRGRRRRALVRDKSIHVSHKLSAGVAAAARDLRNRSTGAAAELKARFRRDLVGDEVIEERVRSELGRLVVHPASVSVTVYDGRVILSGRVFGGEVPDLVTGVGQLRGVREVENQLEIRGDPNSTARSRGMSGLNLDGET